MKNKGGCGVEDRPALGSEAVVARTVSRCRVWTGMPSDALVFEADAPLSPTEVEPSASVGSGHLQLRFRVGQPGINASQSGTGLHWGLGPAIRQPDQFGRLPEPASSMVSFDLIDECFRRKALPDRGIQCGQRVHPIHCARQVNSRTRRIGAECLVD
ncbi:hypothetical protein [Nocardia sp. NPDC049149]|uniref:hypothetical protein n=1 Tax=Nocardia sp. NPDC049149 TaxID=3364315 RepID=UPI003714848D